MAPTSSRDQQNEAAPKPCDSQTCQVRVCVRIRPITAKEQASGASNALEVTNSNGIQLSGRRFTFDSVFDATTSQNDLYRSVAPTLMQSFLDGYNATIIAYGQTGSGKTYTMGSEAHTELDLVPSTGLIPRFLQDLFEQLTNSKDEFFLETSFLEVYGDDIHDLLDCSRDVLPLREDGVGGVVCVGLTVRTVTSAAEAVQVLHEGTMNRSTAATLMNLTSSRSHAVFTVLLKRQTVSSRLTFVDLAGSERMKKTGAEGERAREGIQINMGLLALGNVINALADDERLQSGGKKIHVPYRQSKLTRLLQDALGGNSQTIFLACVSSSDANASETLSTLHYANRARNIQNAPIRNVDFSSEQSQQHAAYISVLENELIAHKFGPSAAGASPFSNLSVHSLLENDIKNYLQNLRELANFSSIHTATGSSTCFTHESPPFVKADIAEKDLLPPLKKNLDQPAMENSDMALLFEVNPDEELAILDQLLDLQQHDQDFDQEQKKDVDELKKVEGELIEKEQLLLHLRDSLKVYHNMKAKYESLIVEVQNLEREKVHLSEQLENATNNPALGCSKAIKREIEVVERSLVRARNETRKHRQMYMKAEQEAQKCRTLELKIQDLKQGRANLIKKQREAAVRHREVTESKTKEIMSLKRKDRNAERKLSKLETEIRLHKRNLENRQAYCRKLMEQKKEAESHLMKLMTMRQRKFRNRINLAGRSDIVPAESMIVAQNDSSCSQRDEEVESIVYLLEKAIEESVSSFELQSQYETRVGAYSDLMRKMVAAVKRLEDPNSDDRVELIEAIRDLDLKIEIAVADVDKIQNQLLSTTVEDNEEVFCSSVRRLVSEKPAPILCTIISRFLKKLVEGEIQARQLTSRLEIKENIMKCFDSEVESLNSNIVALKRELLRRHSSIPKQACIQIETIDAMVQDMSSLSLDLEMAQQENMLLTLFAEDVAKDNENILLELSETKEKLAVAEVSSSMNEGVHGPHLILERIQKIWKELGISPSERKKLRSQIDHCLEDTCSKLLDEAEELKKRTLSEISGIHEDICRMSSSLELNPLEFTPSSTSLLKQLDALRLHKSHLNPMMQCAMNRRQAIAKKVLDLAYALGIPQGSLDKDLIALLDTQCEASGPIKASETYLSKCDKALAELQTEKSKILSNNSALQNETLSMVEELNLNGKEIISLVCHTVRKKFSLLPLWLDNQALEMVSRSVTTIGGVIRTSRQFSRHMELVHETLKDIVEVRRLLANKLRSILERTQQMLLKTVDREFDTNSELSIFQDEIFRLPPLSKEFIHSCFSEIESLSIEVGVMSKSEIESLSVVCEALNVSSANRGMFWDSIDQSLRDIQGHKVGPFNDIIALSGKNGEEWLLSEVKNGTKSFVELEAGLFKLQKIHAKVEELRDRQDSKSKIMSLDAQVRILSAQLQEFENKKCSKQRLTTKKTTSSILLKEERFRKQMQIKFSSKLGQLVSMLKAWKANESSIFDQDLLSEDVKLILKNSDRNEFMHLRTVEYKSSSKRPADTQRLIESESPFPPSKRPKLSNRGTVMHATSKAIEDGTDERKEKQVLSPIGNISKKNRLHAGTINDKRAIDESVMPGSMAFVVAKKKPVLDPFGNVLAQAMSPHPPSNKENS